MSDDLGQLQDLKSDITELSNSPTTIRSPGKSKSPKGGGRGDMRKRKGSQAERRQISAPGALSADCQSSPDLGWDNTAAFLLQTDTVQQVPP